LNAAVQVATLDKMPVSLAAIDFLVI